MPMLCENLKLKFALFTFLLLLGFTLARDFPRTVDDTVAPFAIQLNVDSMSNAQIQFAARNFYGTQKLYASQAEKFRSYDENFLVLHYRLAQAAGPVNGIAHDSTRDGGGLNGDAISNEEWHTYVSSQNWFTNNNDGLRIKNSKGNWHPFDLLRSQGLREDLAQYWANRVILEVDATNSDGVLAEHAGSLTPPF